MGAIFNIMDGIKRSIPIIAEKVGAVLLFFFCLGAIFGYFIGVADKSPIFVVAPLLAMLVMWHDLDEGFLLFVLFILLAIFL